MSLNKRSRNRKSYRLNLTAVIHKEGRWYVAQCPELGTVSQSHSLEGAVRNLKDATELYLEEFPPRKVSRPLITTFEVACV